MAAAVSSRSEWTVRGILTWTSRYFGERAVDSPRLTAEKLLSHSLGCSRVDLYVDFDRPLDEGERGRFRDLVKRRAAGEPVQYIIGRQDFRYTRLRVGPGVLVPRPETELLVEEALGYLRKGPTDRPVHIVDVGTGSGAIAISVASEMPDMTGLKISAVDVSTEALAIGAENAAEAGVTDRVDFIEGNLLASFAEASVDMVVSNPPYIPSEILPTLAPEVSAFEPRVALDGGVDGLEVIRRLCVESAWALVDGGALILEVGAGQADPVLSLLDSGWTGHKKAEDMAGMERVVCAVRRR